MKTEVSPLIFSLVIMLLFVFGSLFMTHSYLLFREIEKIKRKLGNKTYNWLISEVEDE